MAVARPAELRLRPAVALGVALLRLLRTPDRYVITGRTRSGSVTFSRVALAATPALLVLAAAIGWTGIAWGVSTPFLSSAWYCPPPGSGNTQRIAVVNPSDDTDRVPDTRRSVVDAG